MKTESTLSSPYDAALCAAMEYIFAHFEPFAVVASGSIIRGNPDASSDLDMVVLHEHGWRQRVQKWFEDVPAEIFVNSRASIETYLKKEARDGRPVMAHMLTTGRVVYSSSPQTAEIIEMAQQSLVKGPNFSGSELELKRYTAACLFEDAFEIADRDPITAALLLSRGVEATIGCWFAARQRFLPRPKDRLIAIRSEAPDTATFIEQSVLASSTALRMSAAHKLAQTVIGHSGFFEWDSGKSELAAS